MKRAAILVILMTIFGTVGRADTGDILGRFFGHLTGATADAGLDFFTREPNQSELTQLQLILKQVKDQKLTLEQANRELRFMGLAVAVESQQNRDALWGENRTSNFGTDRVLAPPSGRYILFVRNPRILDNILVGLSNNVSVVDTMLALDVSRITFYFGSAPGTSHFLLSESEKIDRQGRRLAPPELSVTHMESAPTEWGSHFLSPMQSRWSRRSDYYFQRSFTTSQLSQLAKVLTDNFYLSLNPEGFPNIVSEETATGLLRSLGFANATRLIPPELRNSLYLFSAYFGKLFAAMGYRFDPSANNRGFFRLVTSRDEQIRTYLRLHNQGGIETGDTISSATIEEKMAFYERVAGAFRVLDEHNSFSPTPHFRHFMMQIDGPRLPIDRPDYNEYFRNSIALAERIAPGKIEEAIRDGRARNWDFSLEACEEQVTRRRNDSGIPRRRNR